jgi:type I restriction enzyme, R subunit
LRVDQPTITGRLFQRRRRAAHYLPAFVDQFVRTQTAGLNAFFLETDARGAPQKLRHSPSGSKRLFPAITTTPFTTAQVIEELIQLAKDIRAARARGEETGLTDKEIAFYDALAENESARQVMGEPALRVIASELVASIKGNVSVDWMHREAARARMRVLVKRLLRKYGYPPDLQDAAVQKVLQQAEALSADWAA